MIRRFGSATAIYTLSNVIQRGILLLLLPVYTRYLSPSDYGVVAVATALSNVAFIVLSLSLHTAATRFYFKYRDQQRLLQEHWGTIIGFTLLVSTVGVLLMLGMGPVPWRLVLNDIPFWPYMHLALAAVPFQALLTIALSIIQAREQARLYLIVSCSQMLVNVSLTVWLVVILRQGASGALAATLLTAMIFSLAMMWHMRGDLSLRLSAPHLKEATGYSLPLVPHLLVGQVTAVSDRFLLNYFIGAAVAGIYNVGYMLASVLNHLADGLNRAFIPVYMSVLTEKKQPDLDDLRRVGLAMVGFYCSAALTLSLLAPEFVALFTSPPFNPAARVVPLIAFGFVLNGVYMLLVNILFYEQDGTKRVPFATLAGGAAGICTNVVLIPRLGLVGAACSALLAQGATLLLVFFLSRKYQPFEWPYLRIIIAVAGCLIIALLPASNVIGDHLGIRLFCLVGGLLVPVSCGLWSANDLQRLLAWLRLGRNRR